MSEQLQKNSQERETENLRKTKRRGEKESQRIERDNLLQEKRRTPHWSDPISDTNLFEKRFSWGGGSAGSNEMRNGEKTQTTTLHRKRKGERERRRRGEGCTTISRVKTNAREVRGLRQKGLFKN